MSDTNPALRMVDVRKVYPTGDDEVVALDRVNLTVGSDEVLALLGPSGSGKTTLCSIAGALLTPTEGTVEVGGTDITGLSSSELTTFRRDSVGFVFQTVNLVPFLTARENLLVVDELGRRRGREARERADQLLEQLGLTDKADTFPGQLSGGQKQRVAIGRALMNEPTLVLFDEPTSALDPEMIKEVLDVMIELAQEGMTMICVTHEMGFARKVANRIIFMDYGQIVEQNDPEAFFSNPQSERARLFLSQLLNH